MGLIEHIEQTKWEIAREDEDKNIYQIEHHLTGRKLYADNLDHAFGPEEWWKGFGAMSDAQVQNGFAPIQLPFAEATAWELQRLVGVELNPKRQEHVHPKIQYAERQYTSSNNNTNISANTTPKKSCATKVASTILLVII